MAQRPKISPKIQVELFKLSKRRCCFCFHLENITSEKPGQIAHVDGDKTNNKIDNLAWLCLEHHDAYDTKTSQSKGLLREELIEYRRLLYNWTEKNSGPEKIPTEISELVDKLNEVQLQLAKQQNPLATVGALYGICEDDLRSLLLEYVEELKDDSFNKLAYIKTLLATEQHEKVQTDSRKLILESQRKQKEHREELQSLKHQEVEALLLYGTSLLTTGRYQEALHAFQEARLVDIEIGTELWTRMMKAFACSLSVNGKAEEAVSIYTEAIKLGTKVLDTRHQFDDYYNLGQFLFSFGAVTEADKFFSKAFNIAKENFSRSDDKLALTLLSLSQVKMETAKFSEAESIARKYLGLLKENGKIDSIYAGAGFYNLAKIIRLSGSASKAEEIYLKALDIYVAKLETEHPQVAMIYNDLGLCKLENSQYLQAIELFDKAVAIIESKKLDLISLAAYIANRGRALLVAGNLEKARGEFEEALKIRRQFFGEDHKLVNDLKILSRGQRDGVNS